jgi:O-antigen biosynthesis protein
VVANPIVKDIRAARQIFHDGGLRDLSSRAVRAIYLRMGANAGDLPLKVDQIADSSRLDLAVPATRPRRDRKLNIGWVTTAPAPGSGGHTTTFRMIEGLEAAGHRCTIYLYDRYRGDLASQSEVIRAGWPGVAADIRSVYDDIGNPDGMFATSWPTAHVLATVIRAPTRRFYLVQDFEPYFYARGSEYELAEDTYRFGYRCIAIGNMVADHLEPFIGERPAVAAFGCDRSVYRFDASAQRTGVVFYARRASARRGYPLALAALEEFHRRHPEQPIHVFGDTPTSLSFPVTSHGVLRPEQIARLYNQTVCGLALSFTNISLVAEEMLAAGTIPVVNDSPLARADISSSSVVWARPTPAAIAEQLSALVQSKNIGARAAEAAASARPAMWKPAQEVIVREVEREIYGPE